MMMAEAGYQWYYSLFSCLFLYSGTCQFLLITFFSSGASLLTVALTVLLVNSRQSFYSLTFLKDFSAMGKRKLYMIHSMTDETYAVNTTLDYMPEDDKHSTMFGRCAFSAISTGHSFRYWEALSDSCSRFSLRVLTSV